ncbi:hypothetical protein Fcan01_26887 [Folsomia candida]|uniref:Uncharacterized protein n=1 Tax=Folsomia candida TaxID=158441 RepID=A0A226D109_FOLCA|nr:hypothetical protein Fcan01_26887 [Folsomia candida]
MTVISICFDYLWLIKGKQTTLFVVNQMLQIELDLKNATKLLKQPEGQKNTIFDNFILLGLKLFLFIGYFLTPLLSVILMVNGLDPQFYFVEYVMRTYPLISFLARAVTFKRRLLLHVSLLMG